jgi:hypothetical protein
MIFAALTLASVLTVAGPPTPGGLFTERTPNLYHQPSYCRTIVEQEVARQDVALKSSGRGGGLRDGLQYAVFRQLDGCAVPTPVGYHPAAEPGAADAPRREDAPSNRR